MMWHRLLLTLFVSAISASTGRAQTANVTLPKLTGVWQATTPDGPQSITVRADSTARFGADSVRWRARADTIFILFGDEWVGYNYVIRGDTLTLSGGDLEEPVRLTRIAPNPRGTRQDPVERPRR